MTVAIVIVSYRSADDIAQVAAALERQSCRDFSLHVCENGGGAAFEALVALVALRYPSLRPAESSDSAGPVACSFAGELPGGQTIALHLARGNLGYAGGVNACVGELATGSWSSLWVLNPDAVPDPDALEQLLARRWEGGFGMVGGRILFSDTGLTQTYGGAWRKWMARGLNIGFGASKHEVPDAAAVETRMDYVSGACMLVDKRYVDAVGLMDESYFLYCEEVDWCARRGAFRLGFAPQAVIRHSHGKTMGSHRDRRLRSRLSVYLDERNRLLFTRRNLPAIYPVVACVTLGLTAQYLAAGAGRNFLHALSGWWAGVKGETGAPPWLGVA